MGKSIGEEDVNDQTRGIIHYLKPIMSLLHNLFANSLACKYDIILSSWTLLQYGLLDWTQIFTRGVVNGPSHICITFELFQFPTDTPIGPPLWIYWTMTMPVNGKYGQLGRVYPSTGIE